MGQKFLDVHRYDRRYGRQACGNITFNRDFAHC